MTKFFGIIKQAASEFLEDDCLTSGAAIAYYAIFSLPPLLVVVLSIVTLVGISQDRINDAAKRQLGIPSVPAGSSETDPQESSMQIGEIANRSGPAQFGGIGPLGRVIGIVVLLIASTGFFAQLQAALNRAWDVAPRTDRGAIAQYVTKRILSLGMILVVALLLLASSFASAVLADTNQAVLGSAPEPVGRLAGFALDHGLTFVLATLMFATVFRFLPDASMRWREVWAGSMFTAALFVIGKGLIAWYMQRANLGASWGSAAGSLIALLAWLYYTSLIVLFGAEVTQVWTAKSREHVRAAT